jgi:hypothetical protein
VGQSDVQFFSEVWFKWCFVGFQPMVGPRPASSWWPGLSKWLRAVLWAAASTAAVVLALVTCMMMALQVEVSEATKWRLIWYLRLFVTIERPVNAVLLGSHPSGGGGRGNHDETRLYENEHRQLGASTTDTSTFETDFDGWTTSTFLRASGSTASSSTGPSTTSTSSADAGLGDVACSKACFATQRAVLAQCAGACETDECHAKCLNRSAATQSRDASCLPTKLC